jgi:hypothetical protein
MFLCGVGFHGFDGTPKAPSVAANAPGDGHQTRLWAVGKDSRGVSAPRDAEAASQAGFRASRVLRSEWLLEVVTILLLLGGSLLIIADFLDLFRIEAAGLVVSEQQGGDQHAFAQVVIGIAVIGATLLARSTGQWPPAAAAAALGLIALGIALIGDLPDATRSDLVRGARFAEASPAVGLWIEIVGAGLTLVSGIALSVLLRRASSST